MTLTQSERELSEPTVEPFHIVMEERPSSPNMWVGICNNDPEALAQELVDRNAGEPYLLIVATQDGKEYARAFTPLSKGIVHLTFWRSGYFDIHATVIWAKPDQAGDIEQLRAVLPNGAYQLSVWDGYHKEIYYSMCLKPEHTLWRHSHVSVGHVYVDQSWFKPRPPSWVEAFMRTFFKPDHREQCDVRRRMFLSIFAALFYLPLEYLIKLVFFVFSAACGCLYNLDIKRYCKPGRHGSFRVWEAVPAKSMWFYRREQIVDKTHYRVRPVWQLLIPINLVIVCLTWMMWWVLVTDVTILQSLVGTMRWVFIPLQVVSIALGAGYTVWSMIDGSYRDLHPDLDTQFALREQGEHQGREQSAVLARALEERRQYLVRELSQISCTTTGEPMSIDRLIRRRRMSVVTIFRLTKDKVCLPYEQR